MDFSATGDVTAQAFLCDDLGRGIEGRNWPMAEGAYPASWYAATRDAAPDRRQLAGQTEADIAVVGGGFAGLHTARLLAQQGQRV
ncbi:MAG: hypothetical protein J0H77_24065, partial [Alphaproteobacteria bacterium]|nr:hypothetical protein [Alphaproteobacteria bacterium]